MVKYEIGIRQIPGCLSITFQCCYQAYSILQADVVENLMAKTEKGNHSTKDSIGNQKEMWVFLKNLYDII